MKKDKKKAKRKVFGKIALATSLCFAMATPLLLTGCTDGKNGKSAYEIAVESGFTGTKEEWLESLKQKPKIEIKNGYWYVDGISTGVKATGDKGDTGSQGPKGDKGETGSQGPKGDKGETGSQGPKGETGDTGSQGPAGPKGEEGVGIKTIEADYIYNADGTACIKFIIIYTNNRVEVKLVPIVARVTNIQLPYTDYVMLKDSQGNINYDYSNIFANVTYYDGTQKQLSLVDVEFNKVEQEADPTDGHITVEVSYSNYNFNINVYPKTKAELEAMTSYLASSPMPTYGAYGCIVGGEVFSENDHFTIQFSQDSQPNVYLNVKATNDILLNFDNTITGDGEYNFDSSKLYGVDTNGINLSVYVYELSEVEHFYADIEPIKVNSDLQEKEIVLCHQTSASDMYYKTITFSDIQFDQDLFSTRGYKPFSFQYEGYTYEATVEIYDKNITNIRHLSTSNVPTLEVQKGADSETIWNVIEQNLLDPQSPITLDLYYYEPVNGNMNGQTTLTRDMINIDNVSTTRVGTKQITITYKGAETTIDLNVTVDLTGIESTQYNIKPELKELGMNPFDYIKIYPDQTNNKIGIVETYYESSESPTGLCEYEMVGETNIVKAYFADEVLLFTIENNPEGTNYISPYNPGTDEESNLVKTYTNTTSPQTQAVVVKVYSSPDMESDSIAVIEMNLGGTTAILQTSIVKNNQIRFIDSIIVLPADSDTYEIVYY